MPYEDARPDTDSHVIGTPKGENRAEPLRNRMTRKADDATGINVAERKPISDKMPWLPPA